MRSSHDFPPYRRWLFLLAALSLGTGLTGLWDFPYPFPPSNEVYAMPSTDTGFYMFVGTYTSGKSEGIYVYRFDTATGGLTYANKAVGIQNPSYLCVEPQLKYLYAVNENSRTGGVSAFSLDLKTGGLTFLNQQSTQGGAPCYVSVDRESRWVFAANYSGRNACVFPVESDGKLAPASDVVKHTGTGADPRRQEGPHPHSIVLDPAERFVFVPDLGLDKIMIYQFDRAWGKLVPNTPPFVQTDPAAGPRHFVFHPSGPWAYSIQELDNTINAYSYDSTTGALTKIQTAPALPAGFQGTSYCADIHVSPDGKFIYGSNRGHDSIVIYQIDAGRGSLTYVGHESTRGKTPRNFALDPTGTYLLAANQDSSTVTTFRRDAQTGRLEFTGTATEIPTPVCLKFIPLANEQVSSTTGALK